MSGGNKLGRRLSFFESGATEEEEEKIIRRRWTVRVERTGEGGEGHIGFW
jgi:hypothetical protein